MTLFLYTDDDFSDMPSPSSLSLNIVNARGCVSIGITNDNIVEGTEMFLVHFIETDDNQITIAGSNTTSVFIEDDEGIFLTHLVLLTNIFILSVFTVIILQFGQMAYTTTESNNSNTLVDIEIANFDLLDIQNSVSVVVNINTTETDATEDGMCIVLT